MTHGRLLRFLLSTSSPRIRFQTPPTLLPPAGAPGRVLAQKRSGGACGYKTLFHAWTIPGKSLSFREKSRCGSSSELITTSPSGFCISLVILPGNDWGNADRAGKCRVHFALIRTFISRAFARAIYCLLPAKESIAISSIEQTLATGRHRSTASIILVIINAFAMICLNKPNARAGFVAPDQSTSTHALCLGRITAADNR
jgi:hypothetical protein